MGLLWRMSRNISVLCQGKDHTLKFGWTVTVNSSVIISGRGSDKDTQDLSVIVEITIHAGAENLGKFLVMPQ